MKNQIQTAEIITVAAPYAVNAGAGALIGSLWGVAAKTLANAEVGAFVTSGVFDLAKTGTQAWTVGQKIYWDNATKLTTNAAAAGANALIGVAIVAVGAGAGELIGRVRLNGAFTI